MSLHNPSNLYSGGNVLLDNTPFLRIAMQQRLRKQALDEASTQYFTKLPEKLNTAGVRGQDMQDPNGNGGIQNDIENWQSQWATNKDAIKKGGMSQQQFMGGFEKIRQKIDESKKRAQTELLIGKKAIEPNGWKPRESDHPIIDALGKSIYDPASKKGDGVSEYGLNDLSLAAAPYTPQYQLKHDKVITANVQPDRLKDDAGVFDPVAKKVTYNYGYTPEKINQIVQTGLSTLKSDRTMYNAMEDALQDHNQVEVASKALQEDYDRTHSDGQKVIVDTPEEMYAGLQMDKFKNAKIPKTFTDKASIDEYNQKEWDRRNAITFGQRKQLALMNDRLIKGRKDDDVSEVEYPTNTLDQTLGKDVNVSELMGNGSGATKEGQNLGTKRIIWVDQIPVGIHRVINPKDINKGINPIKPKVAQMPNGKYRDYYEIEKDSNGNTNLIGSGDKKIGADDAKSNFINVVDPTKHKYKLNTTKPANSPKGKSVSSATIKSLVGQKGYEGYSEKEISDYYKSNGYEIK